MIDLKENIDAFVTDLLHIDDVNKNKLIDLNAGDKGKTLYLSHGYRESIGRYMLGVIADRIGKPGNTALLKSAVMSDEEQIIGKGINAVDWQDGRGERNAAQLQAFIADVYRSLSLKGNNPLFLSVGALRWRIGIGAGEIREVRSPLLLFPIRLIRTDSANTPVYIEFIRDDIYLNPCLLAKLRRTVGDEVVNRFPHPAGEGVDADSPIEIEQLKGEDYLCRVGSYIAAERSEEADGVFCFEEDTVAILPYDHDELCMYYDIKRNRERIDSHPLIHRIFHKCKPLPPAASGKEPQYILPRDSVQERIIKRVVNGESLIIKGPPGTGKTLTITNMIASLLAANKKVLLSSQKLAAMSEVYAKLPDELRKFVMLLDCETESQAARLNPTDVKREFAELLHEARSYRQRNDVYDELEGRGRQAAEALATLKKYCDYMFEDRSILGMSYYEALDAYCDTEAEPIRFADGAAVLSLSRGEYLALCDTVEQASKALQRFAGDHTADRSPWYPRLGKPVTADYEKALRLYEKALPAAAELTARLEALLPDGRTAWERWRLTTVEALCAHPVSDALIDAVLCRGNQTALSAVKERYQQYRLLGAAPKGLSATSLSEMPSLAAALSGLLTDQALTTERFLRYCRHSALLKIAAEPQRFHTLKGLVALILERLGAVKEKEDAFASVFRQDLTAEEMRQIDAAAPLLAGFVKKKRLGCFDLKAKKAYRALKGMGYGAEIPFDQMVAAMVAHTEIAALKQEIEAQKVRVYALLHLKMEGDQLDTVMDFALYCKENGKEPQAYTEMLERLQLPIRQALEAVSHTDDTPLAEIVTAVTHFAALQSLSEAVDRIGGEDCFPLADMRVPQRAAQIVALCDLAWAGDSTADAMRAHAALLHRNGAALQDALRIWSATLREFAEHCFANRYTDGLARMGDLRIFMAQAKDKTVIAAVREYLELLRQNEKPLSLSRFFAPFENRLVTTARYSASRLFTHSVLALGIETRLSRAGGSRYGVGDQVTEALEKWRQGSERMDRASLAVIEQLCLSRIKPDDPDFAFLQSERGKGEVLRKLFKRNASAILKLKKCFILSPSTVSVFFGREEFSDFDIVIVDEASQLEPTAILPILCRAKQVVLVGDEWQMPPIRHFSSRAGKRVLDEEGEYEVLDPDTSVLGLALGNCAFPAEQLICHYRSRTEALIAFSQKAFYPRMRTFPTAVPKAAGLGFKDVFVENGFCDRAVNAAEAAQVLTELRAHFDSYFDAESGTLRRSVGVVAFGVEQLKAIQNTLKKDEALNKKMRVALSHHDDVPEKLIFFKTIETVQGQEADHLILSLTYGKNKEGKPVQSFGELNRGFDNAGKLGQCIFNVAVTRARFAVTVIHSVKAEEITNPKVAYIGEYLRYVAQFSENGRAQFMGGSPSQKRGFVGQVAAFLASCGIAENRILTDCGVTDGSVKLPIAVLSEDESEALLGIWCEHPTGQDHAYLDHNKRYVDTLIQCGWRIHRIYIQDWVDNGEAEREALRRVLADVRNK